MIDNDLVYYPGLLPQNPGPLGRYLPPVPDQVVTTWLRDHVAPGTWILDPFGAAPRLAVEAARAGYRVLVAANNPVARFLLGLWADPPSENTLRAGLADLAATFKGGERLEPHIRSLYYTHCAECQRQIEAEAFLWERGASAPYARLYRCPYCGDAGERLVEAEDIQRVARYSSGGLHRARALERVAAANDPDRPFVEEALTSYLPRAVYALFTLINKLDQFPATPGEAAARQRGVQALILAAADRANNLWAYPTSRQRPRQLSAPARFRENNVWIALEQAVTLWGSLGRETGTNPPLTVWPALPPVTGGLCIYEGRLKDLSAELGRLEISAVLSALPRPNQAYWSLSALWAGWLWGQEAAGAFKSVLRRRRYDWAWHATALHAALDHLAPLLKPDIPFLGLIGEGEPGFLSAALIAAGLAGFDCAGIALRASEGQARILWRRSSQLPSSPAADEAIDETQEPRLTTQSIQDCAVQAAREYLVARGQPSGYLHLQSAGLIALADSGWYTRSPALEPSETLSLIQPAFQVAYSYRNGFVRYGGSETNPEAGLWWLHDNGVTQPAPADGTLSDRVEIALVKIINTPAGLTSLHIDKALCAQFPGLNTPESELVHACLVSYGEQTMPPEQGWRLRAADTPRSRRNDLDEQLALLSEIAERLNYQPVSMKTDAPDGRKRWGLIWKDGDQAAYTFTIIASAVVGSLLSGPASPNRRSVIVYPGSRATLLAFKLQNDPHLNQLANQWRFVKFRHVRRLAQESQLTRENLLAKWDIDPITHQDPQMPLL